MGVTDQELIVGSAEIGTWQKTPYRAGRHLPDLRVEVNSDRHPLSSDLTLDEGAYVFCDPQGRNAPFGLTRIGPGLAARRRRGVGDGEGIILALRMSIWVPRQPRITPRTPAFVALVMSGGRTIVAIATGGKKNVSVLKAPLS